MIAIVDYGAGNIFSVKNALDYLGIDGKLTADAEEIRKADENALAERIMKSARTLFYKLG